MIAWFLALSPIVRRALIVVAIFCLCVVVGVAVCTRDARDDLRRAEANTGAVTRDSAAKEKAADERLSDTLTINAREKERSDATASLPDARPSARRLARACVQLRQQGTRDAALPAICRSGARSQAPA